MKMKVIVFVDVIDICFTTPANCTLSLDNKHLLGHTVWLTAHYLSVISFFTQSIKYKIKIKSKTHQEKSARLLECHGDQRASNFFLLLLSLLRSLLPVHFSAHFFVSDTLFYETSF